MVATTDAETSRIELEPSSTGARIISRDCIVCDLREAAEDFEAMAAAGLRDLGRYRKIMKGLPKHTSALGTCAKHANLQAPMSRELERIRCSCFGTDLYQALREAHPETRRWAASAIKAAGNTPLSVNWLDSILLELDQALHGEVESEMDPLSAGEALGHVVIAERWDGLEFPVTLRTAKTASDFSEVLVRLERALELLLRLLFTSKAAELRAECAVALGRMGASIIEREYLKLLRPKYEASFLHLTLCWFGDPTLPASERRPLSPAVAGMIPNIIRRSKGQSAAQQSGQMRQYLGRAADYFERAILAGAGGGVP